jgi:hypothetical protein
MISDIENTIGGRRAAIPNGTHSVIHQISTHNMVARAIRGAFSGAPIDGSRAASIID